MAEASILEKYSGRCWNCLSHPAHWLKCHETFKILKCLNCGTEKIQRVGDV